MGDEKTGPECFGGSDFPDDTQEVYERVMDWQREAREPVTEDDIRRAALKSLDGFVATTPDAQVALDNARMWLAAFASRNARSGR